MFIFFCYVQVGGGPGLAFITFCDAFLQMPAAPLWSSLFFIMMILLGIDSEFGTLEGVIAPFYDMKWIKMRKELFTGILNSVFDGIGKILELQIRITCCDVTIRVTNLHFDYIDWILTSQYVTQLL